jgi:hypothetical protein
MPANDLLNPCRAHPILARAAPLGVILRRGPSAWVQLVLWHTDTDRLEHGQWFRGRVYERRCHLAPDGALFIYFANKIGARTIEDEGYTYAWTAVSRPPYFTALALWPKGDCWHGGGLFLKEREVWLNHWPAQAEPHPKHLPTGLKVQPNLLARGEDWPIYTRRLALSGWEKTRDLENVSGQGAVSERARRFRDAAWVGAETVAVEPETWEKPSPGGDARLAYLHYGVDWTGTPRRLEAYRLATAAGEAELRGVTWADWDQRGRLVMLRRGVLYACEPGARPGAVANLNPREPERVEAPGWARRW